jgi:hypothetical protein
VSAVTALNSLQFSTHEELTSTFLKPSEPELAERQPKKEPAPASGERRKRTGWSEEDVEPQPRLRSKKEKQFHAKASPKTQQILPAPTRISFAPLWATNVDAVTTPKPESVASLHPPQIVMTMRNFKVLSYRFSVYRMSIEAIKQTINNNREEELQKWKSM